MLLMGREVVTFCKKNFVSKFLVAENLGHGKSAGKRHSGKKISKEEILVDGLRLDPFLRKLKIVGSKNHSYCIIL
jgi:hypothetical protein